MLIQRSGRFVTLLLALALLATACGGGAQPTDTTAAEPATTEAPAEEAQLTAVHGSSPDFIALPPAAAWEILGERGINVDFQFVEDGTTALQALSQGQAQIATNIGVNVGILAVEAGAPIVAVMADARPTWAFVSRDEFTSIEELQGGTVAGHSETSFTMTLAQFYNDEFDLNMDELIIPGSEVRAEAIANDELDASMIDLPDIVRLTEVFPDQFTVLERLSETLPQLVTVNIWMNTSWLEDNPELAKEVVKGLVEGVRRLREDPEFALRLATELTPDDDPAILEALIEEYTESNVWEPNSVHTREAAEFTVGFYADVGSIELDPEAVDLETYFNFDLLEQALDELGRQ